MVVVAFFFIASVQNSERISADYHAALMSERNC